MDGARFACTRLVEGKSVRQPWLDRIASAVFVLVAVLSLARFALS